MWRFFSDKTKHVEILLGDGTLVLMHFPMLPMCHHVTVESLESAEASFDRTSPETKVESVFRASQDLVLEMQYLRWFDAVVQSYGMPQYVSFNHMTVGHRCFIDMKSVAGWWDIQLIVALLVNFLLLFSLRGQNDHSSFELGEWTMSANVTSDLLLALNWMALILAITTLSVYLLHHAYLIVGKQHNEELSRTVKVSDVCGCQHCEPSSDSVQFR